MSISVRYIIYSSKHMNIDLCDRQALISTASLSFTLPSKQGGFKPHFISTTLRRNPEVSRPLPVFTSISRESQLLLVDVPWVTKETICQVNMFGI